MPIYTETQFNKYRWRTIGFMVLAIVAFFIFFVDKFGMDTFLLTPVSIALSLMFGFMGLTLFHQLTIRINDEGVHYQIPFHWAKWQHIPWQEIEQIYVRECALYGEYPQGFKCFRQGPNGFAHAPYYGLFGLQIEKKSGGKYFLGTQYPDELKQFLLSRSELKPLSPA